jgi:hypothetical protein
MLMISRLLVQLSRSNHVGQELRKQNNIFDKEGSPFCSTLIIGWRPQSRTKGRKQKHLRLIRVNQRSGKYPSLVNKATSPCGDFGKLIMKRPSYSRKDGKANSCIDS